MLYELVSMNISLILAYIRAKQFIFCIECNEESKAGEFNRIKIFTFTIFTFQAVTIATERKLTPSCFDSRCYLYHPLD